MMMIDDDFNLMTHLNHPRWIFMLPTVHCIDRWKGVKSMDLLPKRPKEIIRKYEQLDAREELNAACSEIANRISEKQKERIELHGALGDLVAKKTGQMKIY